MFEEDGAQVVELGGRSEVMAEAAEDVQGSPLVAQRLVPVPLVLGHDAEVVVGARHPVLVAQPTIDGQHPLVDLAGLLQISPVQGHAH